MSTTVITKPGMALIRRDIGDNQTWYGGFGLRAGFEPVRHSWVSPQAGVDHQTTITYEFHLQPAAVRYALERGGLPRRDFQLDFQHGIGSGTPCAFFGPFRLNMDEPNSGLDSGLCRSVNQVIRKSMSSARAWLENVN